MNFQSLIDQLLLQHFSPASVLVNENGDIIYISGHTGKYLEPAAGKANMNIFTMLRNDLRNEFPGAFRRAIQKKEVVLLRNVKVGTKEDGQNVDIKIQWIDKPEPLNGTVMVAFTDVPNIHDIKPATKNGKIALRNIRQSELEEELLRTREESHNIREEMQTSQEELKSTNEELQSTNEELQSTNEELTTSKEELQSLNEELQTVNAELQSKVDEFVRVNNDMKNLLNSTDIATMFLDKELKIRRYTNQATKIFKLIKSDIGRPFTDQVTDLLYPEMADDANAVLKTLVFIEKQVSGKNGQWFTVRIMPYRTLDDRIDGLVITFINITDLKKVEEELSEKDQIQRLLLNASSDAIIKLSPDWKVLEFNPEAERFFGTKHANAVNKNFIKTFIPEPERKKTEKAMHKMLKNAQDGKFKIQVMATPNNMPVVEWSVNILLNNMKKSTGMILLLKK
jgi:two-component system, chemotaxis family, CheB/CheR fusion protein